MLSRGQLHAVQTTVCFWAMFAAAASGAAAADLPIEVQQVDLPESLHRVHLYSQRDEPLPDGDRIEFVGRYAKQQGTLIFCDPPWIHVSWREEGKDAAEMQQAFSARANRLPEQAADGAMFRASGAITRNRPD
ncbi:MAG: hypothetical protein KDA41_14505, partial [Planctomycetales bacterium]|nr:hypothetical protein [Planctomycetales bacterium]